MNFVSFCIVTLRTLPPLTGKYLSSCIDPGTEYVAFSDLSDASFFLYDVAAADYH